MSTLSSTDKILLYPHEYDLLERAVELVGYCRPEFNLPPASEDHTAEIAHEQSEAVIEIVRASVELDIAFTGLVKERLRNTSALSDAEREILQERKQILKQRKALGRSMVSSVSICTAFLDFINPTR